MSRRIARDHLAHAWIDETRYRARVANGIRLAGSQHLAEATTTVVREHSTIGRAPTRGARVACAGILSNRHTTARGRRDVIRRKARRRVVRDGATLMVGGRTGVTPGTTHAGTGTHLRSDTVKAPSAGARCIWIASVAVADGDPARLNAVGRGIGRGIGRRIGRRTTFDIRRITSVTASRRGLVRSVRVCHRELVRSCVRSSRDCAATRTAGHQKDEKCARQGTQFYRRPFVYVWGVP
jgi:hypothetical protein